MEKERARAFQRIVETKRQDPDWGLLVDAAWKRLSQAKDGDLSELKDAFEALLKEKNLL